MISHLIGPLLIGGLVGVVLGYLTATAKLTPRPRRAAWAAHRRLRRALRAAPPGVPLYNQAADTALYVTRARLFPRVYRYPLGDAVPPPDNPGGAGLIPGEMFTLNLPPMVTCVPFAEHLHRDPDGAAQLTPQRPRTATETAALARFALKHNLLRPTVAAIEAVTAELAAATTVRP